MSRRTWDERNCPGCGVPVYPTDRECPVCEHPEPFAAAKGGAGWIEASPKPGMDAGHLLRVLAIYLVVVSIIAALLTL